MSAYSELIKNYEKVRSYMREFYIYGFKNRSEYDKKSARSYDDERRRIESWLQDYMSFVRTSEGKNVFISIDSRRIEHNPFFRTLKAKSFTDKDITLHFILFDILHSPDILLSLPEILEQIDIYLSEFSEPMVFDESTVRKKLKEYTELGIITTEKQGKKALYSRACDEELSDITDILNFFSETAPCGVIGSFLLDKTEEENDIFSFKHHYITSAIDSDVLAKLFMAIRQKSVITMTNLSRRNDTPITLRVIPLKIFISAQNGRQHLLCYHMEWNSIRSYRIDYLSDIKIENPTPRFDELRNELTRMQENMWGVNAGRASLGNEETHHVEFTVQVGEDEKHIIRRLEREKRTGKVEKTDDNTYRFSAKVYDESELIPWIRTFICRIKDIRFESRETEQLFKDDIKRMCRLYGIEEAEQ